MLSEYSYISIETLRKNGTTVATPVWFAEDAGKLFVWTQADSGKVKRIRNTPRVRVAPCDQRGGLKGGWIPAQARIIEDPASVERVSALLRKRFGLAKRMFELVGRLRKSRYVGIELTLGE